MTTMSNGRTQRKSLAGEIDRLDGILDGLDAALAGSVETAVRDVVGQAVKEAVETTVREVLANEALSRAASAQHEATPPAQQTAVRPRGTLGQWLKDRLARLFQAARDLASGARRECVGAWSLCLKKVRTVLARVGAACRGGCKLARLAPPQVWRFRRAVLIALGTGALAGTGAYLAGPVLAAVLCGMSGAAVTAAGLALRALSGPASGRAA